MDFSTWLLFATTSMLLAFTPGPAVLLAISTSLSLGPKRALWGSLGNVAGVFLVSAASMLGLGVLLASSALAFTLLKTAGAGYLVYLGVRQWRGTDSPFDRPATEALDAPRSARGLFGRGTLIAVTNPKSILFFAALFPQFLKADAPLTGQFALLTCTYAACALLSHAFYVVLASRLRRFLLQGQRLRMVNRVAGASFVALGLGMLRLRARAA
ncbi:MAG: LysE family translocator [Comamonadaceae bacterium]|nr:MAG: LysE family translocator [Comamonadaceae bacterium]